MSHGDKKGAGAGVRARGQPPRQEMEGRTQAMGKGSFAQVAGEVSAWLLGSPYPTL